MEIATFEELCRTFDNEQLCIDTFFSARWPEGFHCPRCGHRQASCIRSRRLPLYECSSCRYQTSVIAGTIMEGSRTSLSKWFQALFLHSLPSGVSATRLSEIIGVTYKTAWLMGHKIRHAMSCSDEKELLSGLVRLTPSVYGRICSSSCYREPHEHPLVVGASLNEKAEITHIKIKQVCDEDVVGKTVGTTGKSKFLLKHVKTATSEVVSDIGRVRHEHSASLKQLGKATGRWLNSTFHGIGPKHLQKYLDQYSFQINQTLRKVSVFNVSLSWCAATPAITYTDIINRPSLVPIKRVSIWSTKTGHKKTG